MKTIVLINSHNHLDSESVEFLEKNGITYKCTENEGFDFGAWYKMSQQYNFLNYDEIYLVNDSCVLFAPLSNFLNWSHASKADIKGMTLSESRTKHLQSYFLVLNPNAIANLLDYFKTHGIQKNIQSVIDVYEVGFSNYILSKGLLMDAFIDNNGYSGEYSPYYYCVKYHIKKGIPLIKKKIVYKSYREDELFNLARMNFDINEQSYFELIKAYHHNLIIRFDSLKTDKFPGLTFYQVIKFHFYKMSIGLVRIFRGNPINK